MLFIIITIIKIKVQTFLVALFPYITGWSSSITLDIFYMYSPLVVICISVQFFQQDESNLVYYSELYYSYLMFHLLLIVPFNIYSRSNNCCQYLQFCFWKCMKQHRPTSTPQLGTAPFFLWKKSTQYYCSHYLRQEQVVYSGHCVLITPSLFAAVKGCPLPMSPEHGHMSCKTPGSGKGSDISSNEDLLDEGSVCRYDCDPGYAVPPSQIHLAVIRCRAHSWNSTADPSCQGELSALIVQQ